MLTQSYGESSRLSTQALPPPVPLANNVLPLAVLLVQQVHAPMAYTHQTYAPHLRNVLLRKRIDSISFLLGGAVGCSRLE